MTVELIMGEIVFTIPEGNFVTGTINRRPLMAVSLPENHGMRVHENMNILGIISIKLRPQIVKPNNVLMLDGGVLLRSR